MVGLKDFNMPSCCNSCGHWSFSNDDEPLCDLTYEYISQFDKKQDDCPLVEAIPKDQYEARLKADLVAMLTELQLEIEELEPLASDSIGFDMCVSMSSDIIQQKINALKEEDD
jgi:hypothetical protein